MWEEGQALLCVAMKWRRSHGIRGIFVDEHLVSLFRGRACWQGASSIKTNLTRQSQGTGAGVAWLKGLPYSPTHWVWGETHWRKFYPEEVKTTCKHQQKPKQSFVNEWGFGLHQFGSQGEKALHSDMQQMNCKRRSLGENQTISAFHSPRKEAR